MRADGLNAQALNAQSYNTEEGNLAFQMASQKASETGLQLTQDALDALQSIPSQNAAAVLDYVAENHSQLRDPSVYLIGTISKKRQELGLGWKAKGGGKTKDKGKAEWHDFAPQPQHVPAPHVVPPPAQLQLALPAAPVETAAPKNTRCRSVKLIPPDLSPVESKFIEVNMTALDDQLDLPSLMALRCLPAESALSILENLALRGAAIQNINTYLEKVVEMTISGRITGLQRPQPGVGDQSQQPVLKQARLA